MPAVGNISDVLPPALTVPVSQVPAVSEVAVCGAAVLLTQLTDPPVGTLTSFGWKQNVPPEQVVIDTEGPTAATGIGTLSRLATTKSEASTDSERLRDPMFPSVLG
jgi:hypothetical protein